MCRRARIAILITFAVGPELPATSLAQTLPPPEAVLGFKVGDDFHLASYEQSLAYLKALEAASPMIRLEEIGKTSMGKPMICAIITSADNMEKLDRFREISEKLTLAEGLTDGEARKLAADGRAVVYIDGGLHATEVAPAQHNLQLAYDLLAADDPETRLIRDNTILLLNFANPDGMDMVAEWYSKNVGTPYEVSPLPRLYHVYAGHDNNRDSYMLNLKETQAIQKMLYREWYPVIDINHHQTAPFPTRISIPPLPEPLNPNIHPLLTRWKNLLGSMMGAAFDRNDQPGAVSRIVIDGWAPEMLDSVGDLFNTMSMSPETALYRYATPHHYTPEEIPEDWRDFTPSIFYPNPWKGGWWRLKDAVDYVLTCSKSALYTAAIFREQLLYDKYRMGRDTIRRFQSEAPYAWIIPQEQWDPPVAALMLNRMALMGIKVYESRRSFVSGNHEFAAGSWVIPMQQAFGAYVKSIFEEQRYPDLSRYPALWQGIVRPQKFPNSYLPPYDTAGWTLPYQMGVKVVPATQPLKAELERVDTISPPAGSVEGDPGSAFLISPRVNNGYIAVNRILKGGGQVSRTTLPLTIDGRRLEPGTWIVQSSSVSRSIVDSAARELSLKIQSVKDVGSIDRLTVRTPRIALYQSWVPSNDEGWIRWLFEQYEFPYSVVHDADIRTGRLEGRFDVLVIPDSSTDAIVDGHKPGTMPPEFVGGITEQGVTNIRTFIEGGGTLVLSNGSTHFALDKLTVPVTDALKDVRPPPRSQRSEEPSQDVTRFACPGSIVKVTFDPTHPVAYGMPEEGAAAFADSVAFDGSETANSRTTVIARYPSGDLLLSGFLRGGEYLNNKPAALEVAMGKGKVILLGFGTERRAQPHQTFKLFFNSMFYSTSQETRAEHSEAR